MLTDGKHFGTKSSIHIVPVFSFNKDIFMKTDPKCSSVQRRKHFANLQTHVCVRTHTRTNLTNATQGLTNSTPVIGLKQLVGRMFNLFMTKSQIVSNKAIVTLEKQTLLLQQLVIQEQYIY